MSHIAHGDAAPIAGRPYKQAFSHEDARKIIEAGAGSHFNPVLLDIFSQMQAEFARIAQEISD